jgi:glycine oxidase
MPTQASQSVIVVGAGPVGLCCALALAQAGQGVTLVDNGVRGAGWASGGMLGAVYETLGRDDVPQALTDLAFTSLKLWADLALNVGIQAPRTSLFVARTHTEVEQLSALASNPLAAMIPASVPNSLNAVNAWACAADMTLNPRIALQALRAACARAGVSLQFGDVVEIDQSKATLSNGQTLAADTIVLATGQSGGALAKSVPALSHIKLVKGQMLALASDERVNLKHSIRAGRLYLLPRGGQIVVGATSNGDDLDAVAFDLDAHGALYREAIALWPDLARAPIVESWSGFRPMTPDGLPMIGQSSVTGVLLATGTYRNGWLLAPAIADIVMRIVTDSDTPHKDLQSFSLQRFPN